MELKEIMDYQHFIVVGDTINEEKYAYKIKHELIKHGYQVMCVGKELPTLDEANGDIVDLCINPKKGYDLLINSSFNFKGVLIQPGAESKEIKELLEEKGIPYLEGCALVGLRLYK